MKLYHYLLLAVALSSPVSAAQHQLEHQPPDQVPVRVMTEVVVTATKMDDYIRAHPQQVEILKRAEIDERHLLNLEEALNTMAGVDVYKSSGIGARISIRGSGKSRGVLVLLDGRPLNSGQYGGVDLQSIPIEIIESVTVFKPPVPVWLGAGASEGAIAIVTRKIKPTAEAAGKPANQLKLNGGSYGLIEGTLSHLAPAGGGELILTAAAKHRDGKRRNHDLDSGTLNFNWKHETSTATCWEAGGRYYLSERGAPGPLDNPTPKSRQRYEKGSLATRLSGFFGDQGDYKLNLYGDFISLEDRTQSGFKSILDEWTVGAKAEILWSLDNRQSLRWTTVCDQDTVNQTTSGRHRRLTAGGSLDYDYRTPLFTVTGGLRGDWVSDFTFHPGGSLGFSLKIADPLRIKGNLGYTESIPSFGQLYQPSHGSFDQVRGNPNLETEKIIAYDLGGEWRLGPDQLFQLTFFRSDTDDVIVYVRGPDLIYRPLNAKRAWRQGLELSLQYLFSNGLMVDFNYILQDSKNKQLNGELTYTPRQKIKTTLRYTYAPFKTRCETSLRYVDKQYSEAGNDPAQRLDDYLTMDLKAIQPLTLGEFKGEAFIEIINLLDTDFEIHYGYPDDGIRMMAGLSFPF